MKQLTGSSLSPNVFCWHPQQFWHVKKEKMENSQKQNKNNSLMTNTELYWWHPLVGSGIPQPSNWMGLTFAEQGVASAEARTAAIQMHHAPLVHAAPLLSSGKANSRSRSPARTFHLMADLERWGSVAR